MIKLKDFYSSDNPIELKESLFSRAASNKDIDDIEIYANAIAFAIKTYGEEVFNKYLRDIGFSPSTTDILRALSPINTLNGCLFVDRVKNRLVFNLDQSEETQYLKNPSLKTNYDEIQDIEFLIDDMIKDKRSTQVKVNGKKIFLDLKNLAKLNDAIYTDNYQKFYYFYRVKGELHAKELIK